jgi:hypothetical protein
MKNWLIVLADGTLHVVGSSAKPKRSDYVQVLRAPDDLDSSDGDVCTIVDGKVVVDRVALAQKRSNASDVTTAKEAKLEADTAALLALDTEIAGLTFTGGGEVIDALRLIVEKVKLERNL